MKRGEVSKCVLPEHLDSQNVPLVDCVTYCSPMRSNVSKIVSKFFLFRFSLQYAILQVFINIDTPSLYENKQSFKVKSFYSQHSISRTL